MSQPAAIPAGGAAPAAGAEPVVGRLLDSRADFTRARVSGPERRSVRTGAAGGTASDRG